MVMISDNETREASKRGGGEGTSEESSTATEDVWEIVDIVDHLLKSYNQQNKLKNQNSGTNLQDLIANPDGDEVGRSDLLNQTEPGKEKKIEQLAQEFGQQTAPAIPCPISEHLQVINEEDLAAILPDVATSANGTFDEFAALSSRNNDSPSTLIESLDGPYDDVTLLSEHERISKGAVEAESSPADPQSVLVENDADDYSASSTSGVVEQISSLHIGNPDLTNPSVYSWLLKPSDENHASNSDATHPELVVQKSAESTSKCRSLRSTSKRRQSHTLETSSSNCDGEPSIKIDCSVSHISLDSGFGGSPSYTSSPTSAYMYSPMSVDTKSPTSTSRSAGTRTFYEANSFKRSQSPPERNLEKIEDSFHNHSQSSEVVVRKRPGRPPNKGNGRGRKKSTLKKSDICSLVEKFISIEERSKKVVKKSPHRERIKKVRRWLKLERKKKSKKIIAAESNISTDLDKLIQKFNSFTIVEKNPHLTRASNKIVKSKFRCKCCADNYPRKVFSHSKGRKKEKTSNSPKEKTSLEKTNSQTATAVHQSPLNKKKVKRNIEHRSEKCEQRLPLKKRFYQVPMTSHSKTDPSRTLVDFVEENKYKMSSSSSKKSERSEPSSEEKMIRLSHDDSGVIRSMPVTPKKRFQMKHLSTSESRKLASIISKNIQCNFSSVSQTEVNSGAVKQSLDTKTSKISDEICKKMKSVSLMPSNDLNICCDLKAKDLNKVSKTRRNIAAKIATRLSKRILESKSDISQEQNADFDERATVVNNDENSFIRTEGKNQSNFGAEFCTEPSIRDKSSQSDVVRAAKQATNNLESSIISENKDCVKDRKKRRRTFNRTGFPTKKKKKKHTAVTAANTNEFPVMEVKSTENEPGFKSDELICFEGMSRLDLSDIVTEKNPLSVTCLSSSEGALVENVPAEPNFMKRNENKKFGTDFVQTKTLEPAISCADEDSSQSRRKSLRARVRHKNANFFPVKSKEKGCDNITKIKKIRLDHQASIERSKYIISQKQYLTAGLFSNQFKVDNIENSSIPERCNPENNACGLLPPPSYYAKCVRQHKIDFTLPFDIWFSHKKSKSAPESTASKTHKSFLTVDKNGRCDYNFGNSSESSTTYLSSDSAETTRDCDLAFSLLSLDTRMASDCDTEISSCDVQSLTDKQTSYIRQNSCFLVRNLIKAKKICALKNQCDNHSFQNTEKLSSLKSQFAKSFQNLSLNLIENKNIQADDLFDSTNDEADFAGFPEKNSLSESNFGSKMCDACTYQSADSISPCKSCSERCCDDRTLFSVGDVNKSHQSQSLQHLATEIPVETIPSHIENGDKYFKVLVAGNCKIQTGENVYVLKDNTEPQMDEVPSFGRKDCDVFHIERLWRDKNNDGYAYGHYYLRPHETFHEPSRKFFLNELMKSPLCETVPISRIVDHCHVLDLNSYCKGRPVAASMEHVFVCEYRTDKAAKTFSKIPKRKARFCPDVALELYPSPLRPVRDFKPYCPTNNFKSRKKQSKALKPPLKTEVEEVPSTCAPIQNASLIPVATKIKPEQTSRHRRLNRIICKLSEKASSM